MSDAVFDSIFPRGEENMAFEKYFTGQGYLSMLNTEGVMVASVTFGPGCYNNWHIHHALKGSGQIPLCIAGSGWLQAEGEVPTSLKPDSVVTIPMDRKHRYGAEKDSQFSHIAVEVPDEDTSNEQYELVSDEYYENL